MKRPNAYYGSNRVIIIIHTDGFCVNHFSSHSLVLLCICSFVCIAFCRGCLKCYIYRQWLRHIIFWTLKLKGNKVGGSVQDHSRAPIYTFCGGSTTSVHSWIKREMEAIGNPSPTLRQLSFPFSFYKFKYMLVFLARNFRFPEMARWGGTYKLVAL